MSESAKRWHLCIFLKLAEHVTLSYQQAVSPAWSWRYTSWSWNSRINKFNRLVPPFYELWVPVLLQHSANLQATFALVVGHVTRISGFLSAKWHVHFNRSTPCQNWTIYLCHGAWDEAALNLAMVYCVKPRGKFCWCYENCKHDW
jgi:hypothetical protein